MNSCDILVLGGGPAGLSAVYTLKNAGVDVQVYDKNDIPGGLCRSFTIQGFTFDTFAHVNFCRDEYVLSMLERRTKCITHLPEAYNYSKGIWVRNPVQNNLYPLDTDEKINIIKGFISREHFTAPANYKEWLISQYGTYFTENYPAKYTRKYWTVEPEYLEPKWVEGRMYAPSIDEVLRGAFETDTPNVHYSKQTSYPENGGFGSFLRPFECGCFNGSSELIGLEINERIAHFKNGNDVKFERVISTIPLDILTDCITDIIVPDDVKSAASQLDFTSGVMVSIALRTQHKSPSLWFYIYDEDIPPARVYCPDIKSPNNVPNGCSAMQAEIYFSKHKPLNSSLEEIRDRTVECMIKMGLFDREDILFTDVRTEKYANIMFSASIYTAREKIKAFLNSCGIYCAGRFGEWDYLWLGQSILSGKRAAEAVIDSRNGV